MLTDSILTAGQLAGALAAVGGAASPVVWWAYRHLREVLAMLNRIEAEFRPNGGGSLRDSLTRVEKDVSRIRAIERLTVDATGTPAFETDEEGACGWASVGYLDLVDRPIEDIKGHGWSIVIHQEDRERVFSEWARVIAEKRRFELHFRYLTRGGQTIPVHVVAVPVPGGYYGIVTPREAA